MILFIRKHLHILKSKLGWQDRGHSNWDYMLSQKQDLDYINDELLTGRKLDDILSEMENTVYITLDEYCDDLAYQARKQFSGVNDSNYKMLKKSSLDSNTEFGSHVQRVIAD
jgi:hypothetical protein